VTGDSFLATALTGMLVLLFGSVLLFGGYRFMVVLLPILGFLFGFAFGAQTIQAAVGDAFLSTITSWIAGFGMALVFAVLSYVLYFGAVALAAGGLGYVVAVGILQAIGLNFGFIEWLVGVAAGVALAIAALVFNVQKIVVIVATTILGAAVILGTFLFLFSGVQPATLAENPVHTAIQGSLYYAVMFVVLVLAGGAVQYESTVNLEVDAFNRFAEFFGGGQPTPATQPVAFSKRQPS
jgi:hypothetical protein